MDIKKSKVKVAHTVPSDVQVILASIPDVLEIWKGITPLARNEWTCWIISAKKDETRNKRIQRMLAELKNGKRRPCCWSGCVHR